MNSTKHNTKIECQRKKFNVKLIKINLEENVLGGGGIIKFGTMSLRGLERAHKKVLDLKTHGGLNF